MEEPILNSQFFAAHLSFFSLHFSNSVLTPIQVSTGGFYYTSIDGLGSGLKQWMCFLGRERHGLFFGKTDAKTLNVTTEYFMSCFYILYIFLWNKSARARQCLKALFTQN